MRLRKECVITYIGVCATSLLLNSLTADDMITACDWHLFRWVASLPVARVLRWGGMISTPDAALQSVMRRSLLDSGCPLHCVDELMDSAHERRWPPGLGTLEMRQQNRRHFENYVCRRIPGTSVSRWFFVMEC